MGGASAWFIARMRPLLLCRAALLLTPVALLIGLFQQGQSGVHRWISVGPLHWNVAFLCLPVASVAFAATAENGTRWAWWAAFAIECELCLQPDASQATAFAAAIVLPLLTTRSGRLARIAASLLLVLAAAMAWTRPDPLEPVPSVEGILGLARTVSVGLAALGIASLAAACATPLTARRPAGGGVFWPALALCIYLLGCSVMPLLGAFPVPLIGMGVSPILGFWIGIGALLAVRSSVPVEPGQDAQWSDGKAMKPEVLAFNGPRFAFLKTIWW